MSNCYAAISVTDIENIFDSATAKSCQTSNEALKSAPITALACAQVSKLADSEKALSAALAKAKETNEYQDMCYVGSCERGGDGKCMLKTNKCTDKGGGYCPIDEGCVCHDDCIGNWGEDDKNKNDAYCTGGGPRLTNPDTEFYTCNLGPLDITSSGNKPQGKIMKALNEFKQQDLLRYTYPIRHDLFANSEGGPTENAGLSKDKIKSVLFTQRDVIMRLPKDFKN